MMLSKKVSILCFLALVTSANAGFWSDTKENNEPKTADEPVEYGVDVSFPIHHEAISTNYDWLTHNMDTTIQTPRQYKDMVRQPLGNRKEFYEEFLDSCVKHFGKKGQRCVVNEADRIAMSLRQPQSMQNYTEIGFKKIRAPEEIFGLIKEFWDKNKDKGKAEQWGVGNTYTNNWQSPSKMVSVEDSNLRGGGRGLKQKLWNAARNVIQGRLTKFLLLPLRHVLGLHNLTFKNCCLLASNTEWTGQELTECSLYGVRIYPEGSVLATHVDRLPLVSSAIINVAQDVDEPW